jgi:hypothetical protein
MESMGDECVHPDESFARSVKFHQVCRQFRIAVAETKGKRKMSAEMLQSLHCILHLHSNREKENKHI